MKTVASSTLEWRRQVSNPRKIPVERLALPWQSSRAAAIQKLPGAVRRSPALQTAESHDLIRGHGTRENNLKDVSVEIPKRRHSGHRRGGVGSKPGVAPPVPDTGSVGGP